MRFALRAILLLAVFVGGYVVVERFTVYPLDPRKVSPDIPGLREVVRTGADGHEIVVWIAAPDRGKPTVLYLHGNAGNLDNRTPRFRALSARGYGIVAPAYRGSSGSSGWPTEANIISDIKLLYADLQSGVLTGKPTVPILYGESIGAAVAIQLAATSPVRLKAIVLEAPFTSLVDVARALNPALVLATGLMVNRWRSVDYAPELQAPLLILHGAKDELVPPDQGRAIHAAAGSADKHFMEVADAGHINVWTVAAQRRLYRFLASHP